MTKSAAFFRFEGALTSRPTLAAAGYIAANANQLGERVARLGNVALAAPLSLLGDLQVGSSATRVTWMSARDMSEDRVRTLSEEYAKRYLLKNLSDVGLRLMKDAKKRGQRIVLVSDNIDWVIEPVAEHLGVDDVICNSLEVSRNRATGRLKTPVLSGAISGQWVRQFAKDVTLDLDHSAGYGASASDSLLLSVIGHPCAVTPDWRLRKLATDHAWPVVDA